MKNKLYFLSILMLISFYCTIGAQVNLQDRIALNLTKVNKVSENPTLAKPSVQVYQSPYEVYTWQLEKTGAGKQDILVYGKNLYNAHTLFIVGKKIPMTSDEDGKLVRGTLPEGITKRSPIYLQIDEEVIRLPEPFDPKKEEVPKLGKCSVSDDLEKIAACAKSELEASLVVECDVEAIPFRNGLPAMYIGEQIIPASQLSFNQGKLIGYITNKQIENLENDLPIMFDAGTGIRTLSPSPFIFP